MVFGLFAKVLLGSSLIGGFGGSGAPLPQERTTPPAPVTVAKPAIPTKEGADVKGGTPVPVASAPDTTQQDALLGGAVGGMAGLMLGLFVGDGAGEALTLGAVGAMGGAIVWGFL